MEKCYQGMAVGETNANDWNDCFDVLIRIIENERESNPDFGKELELLNDETDYRHDVRGWLEDYLDELDMRGMYAELESVCRKLLELFAWEEEHPSDIRFLLSSALESQGKTEEALSLCREWAAQEPDNPYAAAALIYAEISANNLENAEEIVKQHISDDTVCDEDNDVIFTAAVSLYQKTGNKKMEKKMDHAGEEYDKKLNTYLMGMDDEYEFGDDEDFMDEWPFG